MMIKAVICDTDGMMVNSEMFSVQLARDYGISTETTLPFFKGEFQECLVGKKDLRKILYKYLTAWGWQKTADEFLDYWFKSEHKINKPLVAEIIKLRKKGIKCYLATNQEKHRTEYILKQMGFGNIFDDIFSSAHIGHKKPQAEFFKKMMSKLNGIKKEEVLFWDDTPENVEAAKKFGFNAEIYINLIDFRDKLRTYL